MQLAEHAQKAEATLAQLKATFTFMEPHDSPLGRDMAGLGEGRTSLAASHVPLDANT
jgi:hypothetical protein